jgi:hypothetical protein
MVGDNPQSDAEARSCTRADAPCHAVSSQSGSVRLGRRRVRTHGAEARLHACRRAFRAASPCEASRAAPAWAREVSARVGRRCVCTRLSGRVTLGSQSGCVSLGGGASARGQTCRRSCPRAGGLVGLLQPGAEGPLARGSMWWGEARLWRSVCRRGMSACDQTCSFGGRLLGRRLCPGPLREGCGGSQLKVHIPPVFIQRAPGTHFKTRAFRFKECPKNSRNPCPNTRFSSSRAIAVSGWASDRAKLGSMSARCCARRLRKARVNTCLFCLRVR